MKPTANCFTTKPGKNLKSKSKRAQMPVCNGWRRCTDDDTPEKRGETMNPNWTDLFKANLVKPAWADKVTETEIPFVVHAIDSCIGTNWRKDENNDEQLFSDSNRN